MLTPRGCLSELLGDPGVRGMGGYGSMHNPAGGQLDDGEDEEGSEEEVVDLCEVAGPDLWRMVLQEGRPVLGRGGGGRSSGPRQVALDGAFADVDAQLTQFTTDTFGAPGHVLRFHLLDQSNGLRRDLGLRYLRFGLVSPDQSEQLAMPAEEGIGLDNEEGLSPEWCGSGQENQPDAVLIAELGAFDVALQDDQLLPEEGVFGDKVGFAANRIPSRPCNQRARAGFEAALDAVAELVRNGVEDLRSEKFGEVKHALVAPEV